MLKWIKNLCVPKKQNKYVYLDKEKRWIFCYKKCAIIEHKDCDFYEHNLKCYNDEIDYSKRTHSDSSYAGWRYAYEGGSVLNECKYCLKERRNVQKFRLSDDALKWVEFMENRKDD